MSTVILLLPLPLLFFFIDSPSVALSSDKPELFVQAFDSYSIFEDSGTIPPFLLSINSFCKTFWKKLSSGEFIFSLLSKHYPLHFDISVNIFAVVLSFSLSGIDFLFLFV